MRVVCTPLFCLAAILNSIESSSQSKSLPDHASNPGAHRSEASSFPPDSRSPETTLSLAKPHHSARYPTPSEPPLHHSSRSRSLKQTFPGVLGYRLEELESIRLSPHSNLNREFGLRKYVFPADKPIGVRTKNNVLNPMPTGEQIVLSTSNGDVCAILEKKTCKHTIVRGIFSSAAKKLTRVKINMNSGAVEKLTVEESMECPASSIDSVVKNYAVSLRTDHRSAQMSPASAPTAESPHRDRSRSPTLRQTYPIVLGFQFENLANIRLIPHNYPNVIFQLRIYAFPPDLPIGLRARNRVLQPMPTGDQIVLSKSNGDVCAILLKTSNRNLIFRPIFTTIFGISERVRININSGAVEGMSTEEVAECPSIYHLGITNSYRVESVSSASLPLN